MQWLIAGYAAALFAGQFDGSGNVCGGKLLIEEANLTWRTASGHCKEVPYKVIERGAKEQSASVVLQLDASPSCLFQIIKLEPDARKPEFWNVTAYLSAADFKNPRLQPHQRLECSVHKVDGKS
ncbi:MAG: hypothetical protein V4582_18245 [Pseudomonadota bacterium]